MHRLLEFLGSMPDNQVAAPQGVPPGMPQIDPRLLEQLQSTDYLGQLLALYESLAAGGGVPEGAPVGGAEQLDPAILQLVLQQLLAQQGGM